MAIYEVRDVESLDAWLDENAHRRFKTRPPADVLYEHERSMGRNVRLVRWDDNQLIHILPPDASEHAP